MANPDCLTWDCVTYLKNVRKDGGFVIQAHPFREGVTSYLVVPDQTDGYEVISASRSAEANRHAEDFCASYGKIRHAGTDIHWLNYPRLAGVEGERRFADIHDYIKGLKEGAYTLFDHPQK
jgi:predicted metal-dependent phosphoesterase TrpH